VAATEQISAGAAAGVAGRYASALFDLATQQKRVSETSSALTTFQGLIDGSPELNALMHSPVYKAQDQLAAITDIANKSKITGIALNFLKLMTKNRRLAALPATISQFNTLVSKSRGEQTAVVTSAEPLSAKQLSDLKAALKQTIGFDVALETRVDPSILGGLIVKVGSRMLDNSLKTKLQNLKVAMKGNA
jgi:F-type H+-transporting ATPase subunit delta